MLKYLLIIASLLFDVMLISVMYYVLHIPILTAVATVAVVDILAFIYITKSKEGV